jgi:hypothetical protein
MSDRPAWLRRTGTRTLRPPALPAPLVARLVALGTVACVAVEVWLRLDAWIVPTLLVPVVLGTGWALVRLATWPWRHAERRVVARFYHHVDDLLGAGKFEARRARQVRRWIDLLDGDWRGFWNPAYRPGDIQLTRRAQYVHPTWADRRLLGHRHSRACVQAVTLRWTSEAFVFAPRYFDRLEHAVAQAWGLEWHEGLFDRAINHQRDEVRYQLAERVHVHDVPERLTLSEEFNGHAG